MINAGATPKLIISVNESSSLPTLEVPFINLAILPSKPSINAANIIAIIAYSNLPSKANLMEVRAYTNSKKCKHVRQATFLHFFSQL